MLSKTDARAYIFLTGDEDTDEHERLIEVASTPVAEAWQKSRFNEENISLEKVDFGAYCTDWLIFAEDAEKEELLNLVLTEERS